MQSKSSLSSNSEKTVWFYSWLDLRQVFVFYFFAFLTFWSSSFDYTSWRLAVDFCHFKEEKMSLKESDCHLNWLYLKFIFLIDILGPPLCGTVKHLTVSLQRFARWMTCVSFPAHLCWSDYRSSWSASTL